MIVKASKDELFRKRLQNEPKATVEKELSIKAGKDVKFPVNLNVKVLVTPMKTVYLVLQPADVELSDEELENVAGGITIDMFDFDLTTLFH